MNRFVAWCKEEFIRIWPAVVYFLIAFNVIFFTIGLGLEPGEKRLLSYPMVSIGALIVGKIIILVNALPFINAFPHKPLAYNILWKFFLYCIAVQLVSDLHILIHGSLKLDSMALGVERLKTVMIKPDFWAAEIWIFISFFHYVVFSEFIRVLGRTKVRHILFGGNAE